LTRPGADHHHLSSGTNAVDQRQPFAARGIEARHTALLGLHAGAQIDDDHQVAGGGSEITEPGIGKRGDERDRGKKL